MEIAVFIIRDVFSVAPIFLSLIALLGLLLQKKSFSDVVSGTFKTALGVVILQQGVNILINAITPLAGAVAELTPSAGIDPGMGSAEFMGRHTMEIGIAMLLGFIINLFIARFTKWKAVFLTGHMLFWFPFVAVAVAVNAGLSTVWTIVVATLFTAGYYVIAPNIVRPYIRQVTGDDSFTLGHPSVTFVLVGGFLAKHLGNKKRSTEDTEFPKSLGFLKEISITGSIVIMLTYTALTAVFAIRGFDYGALFGLSSTVGIFQFIVVSGLTFGAGLTVLLLGVRMVIAEIVPAFTGIQEKLIPNAIPAYDCPLLFPYAPNAVIIGFIVSLVTSVITLVIVSATGIFKYAMIPVVITCFFECGTAAVVGNAMGGRRGAYIAAGVSGVLMIFLMGASLIFVDNTIADWMLGSGGQDFSVWAIFEGLVLRLFAR